MAWITKLVDILISMDPELSESSPLEISKRAKSNTPKPAEGVVHEREKIERKFSQQAKEALAAKGCRIIEVGKNLSLAERKLLLKSMGAGLISDKDIERELFTWPESSEYALLPELMLDGSNNKDYEESEAFLEEFSKKFTEEVPNVIVKSGTVGEYEGLEVSEKIKGNGSLWKNLMIRTSSNIERGGEERNCIVAESNIDVWDKKAKDELLYTVPLVVPQ